MTELGRKERFLKVYANLPLSTREEIVYVLENKWPITWNVAYLEVSNDTEKGKVILDKLDELNFI